jgi:adenosylcobinamide-phosphate synthase
MTFFAVLFALLVEQLKPLPRDNRVHRASSDWCRFCSRHFDAGRPHHVPVVWAVAVGAPALLAFGIHALLAQWSVLLALAFDVAVLYFTLGFRQFSHFFTGIRDALDRGDDATAREQLRAWRGSEGDDFELPRGELLRQVLEHSLLAAHRHVFGVFFWFVVLSALGLGPAGAVLYRIAGHVSRVWARPEPEASATPPNAALVGAARRWFGWIDHVPARLTAFGFAVVGNFEEAVAGWRRGAAAAAANEGIILASAGGAIGVALGGAAAEASVADSAPALPQAGHLQSVVGLVWRSVVLWMVLVAVLTIANVLPG